MCWPPKDSFSLLFKLQLDLTLTLTLCHIYPISYPQEDPSHLTDLPDSDDENDPVSHMCWPPKDRGDITDDGGNIIDAK